MSSAVDIFNIALARVKAPPLISENDSSRAGVACRAAYELQRPALLRRHRWPFAIRRAVLTPSATLPAFGWEHQAALPADLISVIAASPHTHYGRDTLVDDPNSYRVEGGWLLCDTPVMYLLYVADVKETGRFDSLFVQTLSWMVASDLALALASDRELAGWCTEQAEALLSAARRANSVEQPGGAVRTDSRLLEQRVSGEYLSRWPRGV